MMIILNELKTSEMGEILFLIRNSAIHDVWVFLGDISIFPVEETF